MPVCPFHHNANDRKPCWFLKDHSEFNEVVLNDSKASWLYFSPKLSWGKGETVSGLTVFAWSDHF